MRFNDHSELKDTHALLGASQYHWIRYDDEQLVRKVDMAEASREGTRKHILAAMMIEMKQKAQRGRQAFNSYVNDSIGFGLTPEVVLFVDPVCYGSADACGFKDNILRISDLKTGRLATKMDQLKIYAAMFCLEYDYLPHELDRIELRIYQGNDGPRLEIADPDEIKAYMDQTLHAIQLVYTRRKELR